MTEMDAQPTPAMPRLVVTPILLAANAAWYLAMVGLGASALNPSAQEVLPFGASFGPYTVNGEWWRLLTATFVHYGVLHVFSNMWCLWYLGALGERMFGSLRFAILYLVSGLGGSVVSLLWAPHAVAAGASGAVFGVAGAIGAFVYLRRVHLPERDARNILTIMGIFIFVSLSLGFAVEGIDNAGHVGGLITGAALGAALHYPSVFAPAAIAALAACVAAAPLAVRETANSSQAALTHALLDLADGDVDRALTRAEEAVEMEPERAEGHEALAALYLEAGRHDDAIRESRLAVELDPLSERAQAVLVRALYFARDFEDAVDEARIALQLSPENLFTHVVLSQSLRELGRYDEAIEAIDEAFKWEPESSFLHGEKGLVLLDRGDVEGAIATLERAIELDPEGAEGYNRLSLVLARAGQDARALESVNKALELSPDAPHILDSLGTVHWHRGEYQQAVTAYERAIELDGGNAVYHYNLALALERLGDDAGAEQNEKLAFQLDPNLRPSDDGLPMI